MSQMRRHKPSLPLNHQRQVRGHWTLFLGSIALHAAERPSTRGGRP